MSISSSAQSTFRRLDSIILLSTGVRPHGPVLLTPDGQFYFKGRPPARGAVGDLDASAVIFLHDSLDESQPQAPAPLAGAESRFENAGDAVGLDAAPVVADGDGNGFRVAQPGMHGDGSVLPPDQHPWHS